MNNRQAGGMRHWSAVVNLWIGLILAVIEVAIGLRFVLKLTAAESGNGFVDLIYSLTGPLVRPFEGIFNERIVNTDGVLEPQSLIALVVYPLIALLLGAIIRAVTASAPTPQVDTWRASARELYVRLSSLHDGLFAANNAPPATRGAALTDEMEAHADELSASLRSLELDPPNPRAGVAVRDVLSSLNNLRAQVRSEGAAPPAPAPAPEGEATPPPASPPPGAAATATTPRMTMRDQLAAFDASLQAFRQSL